MSRNHAAPVQAEFNKRVWDDDSKAGQFSFADDGVDGYDSVVYRCPCGCGELMTLPVATGAKQGRYWQWDGNRDAPTLQPSIRRLDGCRFHGFLTAGTWTFCSDSGAGAVV